MCSIVILVLSAVSQERVLQRRELSSVVLVVFVKLELNKHCPRLHQFVRQFPYLC